MKYEDFEKHIARIIECHDRETKLCQLLIAEGPITMADYLVDSLVEVLCLHLNDTDEWISYWLWELNFGTSYEPGMVWVDGRDTPLKTIKDLWDILQ